MKNDKTYSAARQLGRVFRYGGRFTAAVLLAGVATLAPAAGSWRVILEDENDPSTVLDNEFEATRLRWDLSDTAMAGGALQMAVYRTPRTEKEIVPPANNASGQLSQDDVRLALINSLQEWNRANARFRFQEDIVWSDFYTQGIPGLLPPSGIGLDRVNLISFQDPSFPLEDGVLAVTSFFYLNRDVDFSQETLSASTIDWLSVDSGIDLNNPSIKALLRFETRVYKAGTIIDSDVSFNQATPQWDLPPFDVDSIPEEDRRLYFGSLDIQAINTHELGHVAGLGHTELFRPTMHYSHYPFTDPWDVREIDFDDILSLQSNYRPLFDRLDKGAITGRLLNGDAYDNTDDPLVGAVIGEVNNGIVLLGRVHNTGGPANPDDEIFPGFNALEVNDERFAVDEDTSFTNKVRFFASVLTGQEFRIGGYSMPQFLDLSVFFSDIHRDPRYFVGGLPSSADELKVDSNTILSPGGYVVYTRYPQIGIIADTVQPQFPPEFTFPDEFYGGARPWFQPGTGNVPDPNTENDFLVQDNSLKFGYSRLGQFSLGLAGSEYQLVDDSIRPTESYITYRIVRDGVTTDVTNVDLGSTAPGGMLEDDLNNLAYGVNLIANSLVSTETIELGKFRAGFEGPQSDMRITVEVKNVTSSTLETGLRFLVRTVIDENNDVAFYINGEKHQHEVTLTGAAIPQQFTWADTEHPVIQGVATLANGALVTAPDKLQFANYYNVAQIGRGSDAVVFNYPTNGQRITDGAYLVQFDPRTLPPGGTARFSTNIGFSREREFVDGPIAGPNSESVPGEDDGQVYKLVDVTTNSITGGIDILTNNGTPGNLAESPDTTTEDPGGDEPIGGTEEDDDEDGVLNGVDNCPTVANGDQADLNNNGIGDACDQFMMTFTDVSPVSPAESGNPQNALPVQSLNTYGAAFGDLNNDGYPDLVLANGAIAQDNPQSLLNRVYINIPSENGGGERRFVDQTFGKDGASGTLDDRLPREAGDYFASYHVNAADFDNDGDLDLFFSVFSHGGLESGGQNRFYENIDVDDSSINASPDGDGFGDGFFIDVTRLWDPGILNYGAFQGQYDASTRSDVGDIDADGDIDIIVANRNWFVDNGQAPTMGLLPGDDGEQPLRFSERVLINHTLEPAQSPIGRPVHPSGEQTRFSDETLGEDLLFGGAQDRLPPLKPAWNKLTDTNPVDEIDLSNTMAVQLSSLIGGGAALNFMVFDQLNGRIEANQQVPLRGNNWDGDDLIYQNMDMDRDGFLDGVFRVANYGSEALIRIPLPSEDPEAPPEYDVLLIGVPDGMPTDDTTDEIDLKPVSASQTQFGLVFDSNFSGWNEMFTFNTVGQQEYFTNRRYATEFAEFSRGRGLAFASWRTDPSIDYFFRAPLFEIRDTQTLPRFGRTRSALVEDLNLDGLPDVFVANDSTSTNDDVTVPNLPPGYKTVHLNAFPALADEWFSLSEGTTTGVITNELPQPASFVVSADFDLDGDIDVASFNSGTPANLYRNNLLQPGRPATVLERTRTAGRNPLDTPLFVDQTNKYLAPYSGGAADLSSPDHTLMSNITLGADLDDIDGDGDLDLVFANGGLGSTVGENQILYKNTGKQLNSGLRVFTPTMQSIGAPAVKQQPFSPFLTVLPSPAHDVRFFDVDGDGRRDIFFTNNGQIPRIFLNTDQDDPEINHSADEDLVPDGAFVEMIDRLTYNPLNETLKYLSRRMAVGDVNNDGHADVVVANGADAGAPNVLLLNGQGPDGTWGYFTDHTETKLPQVQYVTESGDPNGSGPVLDDTYDVALIDVDNDGDLDIIFANGMATDGQVRPNRYDNCRLLLNNLEEAGTAGFKFVEVAEPGTTFATRLSEHVPNSGRWPLALRPVPARGLIVGDFSNKGEHVAGRNYPAGGTEDRNGNRMLEATEDLNGNGVLDFDDLDNNGRHSGNYDIFVAMGDEFTSNIMLVNQDTTGDGTSDGVFVEETEQRLANIRKFPTYGGDAGDVNNDGLIDLVLAIVTQGDPTLANSGGPTAKAPVQLLINMPAESDSNVFGYMVDVSGHSASFTQGEVAPLITQHALGQYANFPGNCRQIKLADVDNDADLDMIICEAGRVTGAPPYGGWANSVMINMINPENQNSLEVLSVRDPGGPLLQAIAPAVGSQGQTLTVRLFGRNFGGSPTVEFGPGVTVLGPAYASADGTSVRVPIRVAPDAQVGPRNIKITNPDGMFTFGTNTRFEVLPANALPPNAVGNDDWQLYQ